MLKRMLVCALALLLAAPSALAESDQIAQLEDQIAQLEAENAELRELLSQEPGGRLFAASFDGGIITVSEAKAEYDYMAYTYESLGFDPDEYEDIIKEEVLANLVESAILESKARELGVYEPTDEQEAQIRQEAQQEYEEMVEYYLAYQADPEKSDEENRASVESFLASEGTTLEGMVEDKITQSWGERLYQAIVGDAALTDEQLRAFYDEACSTAELNYTSDPVAYEIDRLNGEAVFWNPEGYRRVKRVLIGFDDASAARMAEINETLEPTADQETVTAAVAEIEQLYRALDPVVEEVRTRIEAGDDFDLIVAEYGADPYMESEAGSRDGYYVRLGSEQLDPDFVSAAMALAQPGDVSDPIECADGVYILRYEADVEPGAISYEAFLADEALLAYAEETLRAQLYNDTVDGWIAEANVQYFPENF